MPKKEKVEQLAEKWSWLLEGLSKAKYKRYKYSRIYENISSECEKTHVKILLPLTYRVIKKLETINVSRSSKNSIVVLEVEKHDLNIMDLDSYISFLDAVSDMIIERLLEKNILAMHSIRLNEKEESYELSVTC